MVGKRGDDKYYILISLIIGLMVLGLGLYFIFNELFTEENTNYEVCRQSVILRAQAIESGEDNNVQALLENFAFNCQNNVIEIDYEDTEAAKKTIANEIASCHALYGEGKLKLYSDDYFSPEMSCFVCSRVHFNPEIIEAYDSLDMGSYLLNTRFNGNRSYADYLYGNIEFTKGREAFEEELKERSIFNAEEGDILIVNMYSQKVLYNPFAASEVFGSGTHSAVHFFQPTKNPEILTKVCNTIETIPA